VSTFLWISTGISFAALCLATLMERAAIVGKVNGANGMIILFIWIASGLASLLVAAIAGIFGGWGLLLRVLGGSLLYHAALGPAAIAYLQWLANRSSAPPIATREAASRLADSMRRGKRDP
jgi:hypothetical protein